MKLLAFTGKMGAGKSTVIDIIKQIYPDDNIRNLKFAQPLYDIQEFIYRRVQTVHPKPEGFIKDRKLLQWLGTEWGRGISQSLWVDLWKEDVKYIREYYPHDIFTCDDLRFDNEAVAIKQVGGHVIKIENSRGTSLITTANGTSNHASEQGIDPKYIDFVIPNNGTIDELRKLVHNMIRTTLKQGEK